MPRRGEGLRWSQVRVGVVIVVAVLIGVLAIFSVGKLLNLFAKRYTLYTLTASAAGLPEGAPVTLAGQRVGEVEAITFIPMAKKRGKNNVSIRLGIARDVADQIRRNSTAMMRAQGLLGEKYIDITPGSIRYPVLQPGDTIPLQPSVDFDVLLTTANQTLDTALVMIGEIRSITRGINQGRGTLGRMVVDDSLYLAVNGAMTELRTTLAAFNDPNGSLGRIVHDPALYNRLLSAVSRVDSLGALIEAGHGSLGKLLTSDELYTSLLSTVDRADSAVGGLVGLTRAFGAGNGTIQRLLTDPTLYDQFLKAAVDLQTLINDIRAQPKKYMPDVNVKVF